MCYTEWNISDRERKMLYVVTYILTLKWNTNEYNKAEIDLQI